jgi:hypothetical protein
MSTSVTAVIKWTQVVTQLLALYRYWMRQWAGAPDEQPDGVEQYHARG